MDTGSSAYLFIFRESTPEAYDAMSPEQRRQSMQEWNDWCDRLAGQGRLQLGHPLEPQGRVVAAARARRVVDGPFVEAKELVGGFLMVTADDLDEATSLAEECPNLRHGLTIEVRPVAAACHLARSLGWETMREPAGA
jgi:hypothetical protein